MLATTVDSKPKSIQTRRAESYSVRFPVALLIFPLVLIVLLFVPPTPDRTSYLAAIVDKNELLARTHAPRVILVGGSNLAFGIDSVYMQKELGRPVINTGLHAGLGLRYMLKHVQTFISPGDIVVVSPEYEQFDGKLQNGATELLAVMFLFPEGIDYLSAENIPALICAARNMLHRKVDSWRSSGIRSTPPDPIYCRTGFNGHGDVVSHLRADRYYEQTHDRVGLTGSLLDSPNTIGSTIGLLNDFNNFCAIHGAKVLYAFPPLPESYAGSPNRAVIGQVDEAIRRDTKIVLVSKPDRYIFPNAGFLDTYYHLVFDTRRERTKRLIQDVRPYVSSMNNAFQSNPQSVNANMSEKTLHSLKRGTPSDTWDIFKGLGAGWYPLEQWQGTTFRWASNDAEIWLPLWQSGSCKLLLDIEPGPSLGTKHCVVQLLDAQDKLVGQEQISGRKTIEFPLSESYSGTMVKLHFDSDNKSLPNDPRVLNARAFKISASGFERDP